MRNKRLHVEAVGKHLQLETQPCTNANCKCSSKPMTGTAGDPVMNCMSSDSSISGTPEKKGYQLAFLVEGMNLHHTCTSEVLILVE